MDYTKVGSTLSQIQAKITKMCNVVSRANQAKIEEEIQLSDTQIENLISKYQELKQECMDIWNTLE